MPAKLRELAFSEASWARLTSMAEVQLAEEPISSPVSMRRAIGGADVVATSWGCPPIDHAALSEAPDLALLANYGATVKPFVTPTLWASGVQVT